MKKLPKHTPSKRFNIRQEIIYYHGNQSCSGNLRMEQWLRSVLRLSETLASLGIMGEQFKPLWNPPGNLITIVLGGFKGGAPTCREKLASWTTDASFPSPEETSPGNVILFIVRERWTKKTRHKKMHRDFLIDNLKHMATNKWFE